MSNLLIENRNNNKLTTLLFLKFKINTYPTIRNILKNTLYIAFEFKDIIRHIAGSNPVGHPQTSFSLI